MAGKKRAHLWQRMHFQPNEKNFSPSINQSISAQFVFGWW